MTIKELKEFIKNLPDDMLVIHCCDGNQYNTPRLSTYIANSVAGAYNDLDSYVGSPQTVMIVSEY